ncbi:MAG: ABC transporter ATP-binding protein [bacterium]|nr:ABC transporter ATP-binding protein [bacterium]
MSHAIKMDQISKRFGKLDVLDRVSLSVPQGTVFALLGENGAGKSTLIRGMLGYHKFNSGTISVLGMDPARETFELRRRVGYVADAPGLYEWMTVAQAGWYASGFYPEGFLQNYDRMVQEFSLRPDAKIRDLSKGMRAKVALALAVAFDPELLVLDEPTSGLDPLVRRSFLESMIDRAAGGKTVFISSHQIHEVERIADWVGILHQGRLQVVSPLEELKNEVAMLSYSVRDPLLAQPDELERIQILHQSQQGRTVTCMARGCNTDLVAELRNNSNLMDVNVVRPNLEELYIGFTQPIAVNPAFNRDADAKSSVA